MIRTRKLAPAIEALVARMGSFPEEFFSHNTKWAFIDHRDFRDVLSDYEKSAVMDALKSVRRKEYEALVMRTLLDPKEHRQEEPRFTLVATNDTSNGVISV